MCITCSLIKKIIGKITKLVACVNFHPNKTPHRVISLIIFIQRQWKETCIYLYIFRKHIQIKQVIQLDLCTGFKMQQTQYIYIKCTTANSRSKLENVSEHQSLHRMTSSFLVDTRLQLQSKCLYVLWSISRLH